MLFVYTHQLTDRVRYSFNLIFKLVLGVDYQITSDVDRFRQYTGAKINYSFSQFADELFIKADPLLFSKGINPILTIPEDIFAMTFLFVTRYEEYLPFKGDQYGRFYSKLSLQSQKGLLYKPIVNIKARELKQTIKSRYPNCIFSTQSFSFLSTIDIDTAYAYKGRNCIRTFAGYAKSLLKFNLDDFKKRWNVLLEKEQDPFDTYQFQFQIQKKYNLKPLYFFLLADWAQYDKNIPYSNKLMQNLVKNMPEVGLHPSFESNKNIAKVSEEKKRLEQIISTPVKKSKQHFLMLAFPHTYRNLLNAGITDDYSMGYSDDVGFRAGICTPFYWYDLEKEEETKLMIHPVSVMDATLNAYLGLNPEQALQKVNQIIKEIKDVQGEFLFTWHNETFSDWREWKGWKEMYEKIICNLLD